MKSLVAFLLVSVLPIPAASAADIALPAIAAVAPFVEQPATAELMKDIRKGGFILYLRHGTTDNTRPDRVPSVDLADCNTQRPLSEVGRSLMKQVGRAIKAAHIPLGEILVSPMCRTKESAQLAIGDQFEVVEPLMYSANMTSEEKKPRIAALKKILSKPVPQGANRLLIAHAPNLNDLIGFFVKPEGTLVVFRQAGPAGYEYVASIHPDDWAKLAK